MSVRWICETREEFMRCCGTVGLGYYRHDLWRAFEPLSVDDRCRMLDIAADFMLPESKAEVLVGCLEAGVPFSYVAGLLDNFSASGPIRQLYEAGVPTEYFIAVNDIMFRRMVSIPFGYIMSVYAAGVSAEYAVACAGRFNADRTVSMWREGIPLEYIGGLA